MLELTLTRIFSATMYYHFAFMAISLALFGSGASGVFVYLIQPRFDTAKWLSIVSGLFSLSMIIALYVVLNQHITIDGGSQNYYKLTLIYAAASVPFFCAGCAITIAISKYAGDISRLYLFDLAGAAIGCLLLIPVLNTIGAINAVLLVAVIASAGALVFSLSVPAGRVPVAGSVILFLVIAGILAYNLRTNRLDVRTAKGIEETNVLFSKWNSFSRVTVTGNESDNQLLITIDADAATLALKDASNTELHHDLREDIDTLVYNLKKDASVLIIGPGGGKDVAAARVFGQRNITAVEVNPIIALDVMSSEPFKTYAGSIYQQPGVNLVVDEARSFIRNSTDSYDIIQGTMVDTWAATAAGAFALTENNLYTVEAFKDYITHLTPDGMLSMTRWHFEPPDQLLRLVTITRAAMNELGIPNPDRHLIVVTRRQRRSRSPATFIFKKSEFNDEEVRLIEQAAAEKRFDVLYSPITRPENIFKRLIEANDPAEVWDSLETNIEPSRDNYPFFFNSIRLSNFRRTFGLTSEWQKTNLGTLVLFIVLLITVAMVILFIVVPLGISRGRVLTRNVGLKIPYLLYFACLGAGFIIVEVIMIQKCILFLGHPIYSLAVVLFSILIFSGIGSYLSGRFRDHRLVAWLSKSLWVLVALVILYVLLLSPAFYGLVHLALPLRILITIALLMPLGIVMGMPMPIGIRLLHLHMPELIPWAWGVNGAASVLGSAAALSIAILTGFNEALIIGASLYVLALLLLVRIRTTSEREPETAENLNVVST
jgi:predicted membrane-bound spermidine synthase